MTTSRETTMQAEEHRSPPAGSFRELLQVALPLVLSAGSVSLMNVIDRILLTWYSTDALAAAMPAGMLHFTVLSVALGTVLYVNTFVAQYEGAGTKDRVAAAVWQGVYLALFAGVLLLAFVPLSAPFFSWVGHEAEVQRLESEYFSVLCAGSIPFLLSATLSCFYSGRGKTMVVLWVSVAAVSLNAVLDYCLIFGAGPFPQWGIRGAAVATVIAKILSTILFAVLMLRPVESSVYRIWANRKFDRELFRRLLRYGLPSGFQFLADIGGFSLFILLVGTIGTQQLAATNLAFNLNSLAFIPLLGFGTAVMTLVGKRIGERRPELAVRTTWTAFAMAGGWTLLFVGVYLFAPDVILYPYARYSQAEDFAAIRTQVISLLRFVAIYSFFDAMAVVFGGAVRGAGDTRFCLVFSALTCWLLMVLPTVVMFATVGVNLPGCWAACTVYIVVLGVGFVLRFRAGHWRSMRVIEPDVGPDASPERRANSSAVTSAPAGDST